MTRKTLTAFAVIAIGMTMLLLASCSFLIPNTIKITNMSAGSVEITCESFTDGTTCTIPAYGSVTKTVSTGTTSIYIKEQGMYYQKGFEVVELNASGTVELTPDTSWVRLVNNSGYEISSAKLVYNFNCDNAGKTLSSTVVANGGEIWMMVTNPFSKKTLSYVVDGKPYNSMLAFTSPKNGNVLVITLKSLTEIEQSYSS